MLLLLIDVAFFQIVAPFLVALAWLLARSWLALANACGASLSCDPALDTPWDLLVYLYVLAHGVKVVEESGSYTITSSSQNASLLRDSESVIPREGSLRIQNIRDFQGAILSNHRSWGDFAFDPMQAHATVVARFAAVALGGFTSLMGLASHRVITIFRGKTSRQELQRLCATHERYLIYPEGTRRAHTPNADEPALPLKPGGLKNIYEAGHPALIVITVGKELIVSERRGTTSCGRSVVLCRVLHEPILPASYESFDNYLSAIEAAWLQTWRRAYQLWNDTKEAKLGKEFDRYLSTV